MTLTDLKTTPLCQACKKAGGKMVDFHGWLLPVQFNSILTEHKAVRENAGMFDVSHMGQFMVEGKDAWKFLQHINCNNIKNDLGAGTYSHILTEQGTIIDDAISFCLSADKFLVVVNAACIDTDFAWFTREAQNFDVSVRNESDKWGMIALQGPNCRPFGRKNCHFAALSHYVRRTFRRARLRHTHRIHRRGRRGNYAPRAKNYGLVERFIKRRRYPVRFGRARRAALGSGIPAQRRGCRPNPHPLRSQLRLGGETRQRRFYRQARFGN